MFFTDHENMRRFLLPVMPLLLALLSCNPGSQSGRDPILLVKGIAADTSGEDHQLLASFSKVPASGDIYIVGSKRSCEMISRDFMACDVHENARGREWSDGLKDFAGETFASVCDDTFSPADSSSAAAEALRERAVRYALAALSSRCNVSVYDLDGNLMKNPAKLILLAEPGMLQNGKFDIDTLFTLTGCKVPVLSPQELLLDAALGGEKKHFNIGILCDSLYIRSGVYKALFEARAREHDIVGARCFTAATPLSGGPVKAFLDAYIEAGNSEPLEALLIDDWSVDQESVLQEIQEIRDFSREEYLLYGKLLAPTFTVFSSSAITMNTCYGLLRERSLFTHRIAQPAAVSYTVKPRPDAAGEQFLLIPSENVQD